MHRYALLLAATLVAAFAAFGANTAYAQATRTWVSGVGDDVNPCSRTAPCKTFAGAISKTAAGGEINVLDPGGFGAVTITKSLTIDGSGGSIAGVLVASTNGIVINDSGAGTAVVTLRNLDLEGIGFSTGGPGIRGVWFISGAALHVQKSSIRNFRDATNGTGILFSPSGAAELYVEDTVLSGNGNGSVGGGIFIRPTGSGSAKANLLRVNLENNVLGIRTEGAVGNGSIFTSITDSLVAGNTNSGVVAFSAASGPAVSVMIKGSTISQNGVGLNANGAAAVLRIGSSVLTGNGTGTNVANGATMTSYGNNQIAENPTGTGPAITISGTQ